MKLCSITGCEKAHRSNGMCSTHNTQTWRAANADRAEAWRQDYYQNNKKKIIKQVKEWRQANKDKALEYSKTHYKENIEKYFDKEAKRRALILFAPYDDWQRTDVIERDKGICQICFEPVPLDLPTSEKYNPLYKHIDHIIGLAQGGTHLLDNVRLTHSKCNLTRTEEQERLGE